METTEKKIGWRVVIATAGFVIICNTMTFATTSEGLRLVILGTHSIGMGVLFLLAYYHENESVVFRVLIWVCEHSFFPRGRRNAFFYFAVLAIVGMLVILQGLGIINLPKRG
jgi:hypothetical protein